MSEGGQAFRAQPVERLGVSLGTAAVLGLSQAPSQVAPTTAYLMLGGRCLRDCAFCAQARSSVAAPTRLSRVDWPEFRVEDVLRALAECAPAFQRVCIQATSRPSDFGKILSLVARLRAQLALPVDVSALPPSHAAMEALFGTGIDHLGFGVDAATEAVFKATKGDGWSKYRSLIMAAIRDYPDRVAVHLIVGLGESEAEMCRALQEYHDLGAVTALFAFTPVPGTRLGNASPPALASYRRLQLARYLIVNNVARIEQFRFTERGALAGFGQADIKGLSLTEAFRTSGCPGCNRPFYNERPSGPQYNYARPLHQSEAEQALAETGLPGFSSQGEE